MAHVWIDGQLKDSDDAKISVFTHAFHYGTAVFDGCRFYRTADGRIAIFRLREHLERFARGVRMLHAELSVPQEELRRACHDVVRSCGDEGYLRQIAYFGEGTMGVAAANPLHVAVLAWKKSAQHERGLKVRIAGFGHGDAWVPGTKLAGHYARAFLARREAAATGCDDAIFLGQDGMVAEATAANVFAVIDGALVTPPLSAPILHGITRASILALAGDAGIRCVERPLRRDALLAADEIFLASSGSEIQPVASIEGMSLKAPGRITSELSSRLAAALRGADPRHSDWVDVIDA